MSNNPIVYKVELSGTIVDCEKFNRSCAETRTYLSGNADTTEVLLKLAKECALDAATFWQMPRVVEAFLFSEQTELKNRAWKAAYAVACKQKLDVPCKEYSAAAVSLCAIDIFSAQSVTYERAIMAISIYGHQVLDTPDALSAKLQTLLEPMVVS